MNNVNDAEDAVSNALTSAAVVADLTAKHVRPRVLKLKSPDLPDTTIPVLVLPRSLTVTSIATLVEPYLPAPKRRQGTAKVTDIDSFISLVNRFKDDDSALFANRDQPHLLAVLDYNERNADEDGNATEGGRPRFGQHRVLYTFPVSDEWAAWKEKNGEWFTQGQFAEFIDDRILDVGTTENPPGNVQEFMARLGIEQLASPTRLLELSRGLSVHVNDRTSHRVNPSTGETILSFEAQNNTTDAAGVPITVPRAFIIAIPVFQNGVAYRLPVRLKYRAGSGQVAWSYEIHDMDRAFDLAFREACGRAEEFTERPLYYGSPEA